MNGRRSFRRLRLAVKLGSAIILCPTGSLAGSAEMPSKTHPANGWTGSCWPGNDGFAADCYAEKQVGKLRLSISVADDQFVQAVQYPGCASPEPFTLYRDQLFGLSPKARQALMLGNFVNLTRALAMTCNGTPGLGQGELDGFPDIGVADAGDLQRPPPDNNVPGPH